MSPGEHAADATPRELLLKTSATRDGHESFAPDLCPNGVGPWPGDEGAAELVKRRKSCSEEEADEFPPVKSPLLMRARRVSLDSQSSTPSNKQRSVSPHIGPEEPPWLRQRKAERLSAEARHKLQQEVQAHLQAGRHFHQTGEAALPSATLFGAPGREDATLYLSNLDVNLTSSEGLLQDLRQCSELPEILDVRMPLRTVANAEDPVAGERKPVGNRGYAYLQFKSAKEAQQALAVITRRGVKVNGLPLHAAISTPTAPVYEPKTLFMPAIPKRAEASSEAALEAEIKTAIESRWDVFLADACFAHKRALTQIVAPSPKKPRQNAEAPPGDSEPVNEVCDTRDCDTSCAACPWRVTAVRLKSEGDWTYGYVEFKCRSNALEILSWCEHLRQSHLDNPLGFVLGGQELILAPSIPKKQRAQISKPSRPCAAQLARTLHISNLPAGMKEAKVRALCEEHGSVSQFVYPVDPQTSEPLGWALVEYASNVESAAASELLQGRKCGPKTLRVQPSKSVITFAAVSTAAPEETAPPHRPPPSALPPAPVRIDLTASSHQPVATTPLPTSNDEFRKSLGL